MVVDGAEGGLGGTSGWGPRLGHALRWAALLAVAGAGPAWARPVFKPPGAGLWIVPSDRSGRLYGASSPDADWAVAQWNIPQDLPGFAGGVAENQFARVKIEPGGGFLLSQTGDGLSCSKTYSSGLSDVHEFDLFLRPINDGKSGTARADIVPVRPIGAASSIIYAWTVQPLTVSFLDSACPVTRALFQTAVTLVNPRAHQTIFYQLRLASAEPRGGRPDWFLRAPFWFLKGHDQRQNKSGSFGFDDNIQSFGQDSPVLGQARHYSIDLLPRLRELIADGGQYGVDQDLAGWKIRGVYQGQISWGHTRSTSRWSNFSLDED